jgi:predicted Zn-dependent protease
MFKGLVVKTSVIKPSQLLQVALVLIICFAASSAFGSSHKKCSKPACDINPIGHRKLVKDETWFSPEKEKAFGDKFSAALEQRVELLTDERITAVVDRVAQHIAQNSDAQIPVTVRVIRSNNAYALTLPGGHLYLTSALLLQLRSEGELASMLARGIAHIGLHTAAREQTRTSLMQLANVTVQAYAQPGSLTGSGMPSMIGMLDWERADELSADFFGIQYIYKAGYETDCFLSAIQNVWKPDPAKPELPSLSPFPPLADRMKALQKEIDDILPRRADAIVSTPEFDEFMQRLRTIAPVLEPQPETEPTLIRHEQAVHD